MATAPVVVIGAGVGGLVTALELAAQGVDVVVLEAADQPGGKMRQVQIGDAALDAGPTVFTMRWVFEALFDAIGERLDAHLQMTPLELLARHAWSGGERLDLHADAGASAEAIAAFAGRAEADRFLRFTDHARAIFNTLDAPYLRGSRPNPVSLTHRVGLAGLPGLARISPFGTLWGALGRYFHDPRLRQLFGRYATYCGSSPFAAPGTLMLVAHVEQAGVWSLDGGMHRLAVVLAQLAQQRGARFRYGQAVQDISLQGDRVTGVRLASGERIAARAVVFNGDASALSQGLLGAPSARAVATAPRAGRSLSAVTWNIVAPTTGFPLARHNVFFGDDYAAEFDDLFKSRRLPQDPTVYVCAQDRGGAAPLAGHSERLLCLVNAPADGDRGPIDTAALARCEAATFDRLTRSGLRIDHDSARTVRTTPADFDRLFPGTGGALYGAASHGWLASFTRPGARSRVQGLYLAGGSAHPGPGVPMAALSGRQAAGSVLADLGHSARARAA